MRKSPKMNSNLKYRVAFVKRDTPLLGDNFLREPLHRADLVRI